MRLLARQPDMSLSVSLLVSVGPDGSLVAPGEQCVGIDVTAGGFAPGDELVRAHVRFDGEDAACLDALKVLFSRSKPIGIGGMPPPIGQDSAK